MEFIKYPSITNSYQQEFVDNLKIYSTEKTWFVQEKIHGANFAFYSDGSQVKCAKRTGFIEEGESFYNYEPVLEKYKSSILKMAKSLGNVIVFGELFGGHYNGQHEGKLIQRGVHYCPHNDFFVFDIMVNGEFAPFATVMTLCGVYGLKACPVLLCSSLEGCLNYPNDFITKVPDIFGLPAIDGNFCEGVVIRPNNSIMSGVHRAILKNKNSHFKEKDERPIKITIGFPEELQPAVDEIAPYINKNRVAAVASKIGDITVKDFQKLMGLTLQDALEEAGDSIVKKLEPTYKKMVTKELQQYLVPVVREYFGVPS